MINVRITYNPPKFSGATKTANGNIGYKVRENGGAPVSFGPVEITNLEGGFFDGTMISLYQQARGSVGSTTENVSSVFSNLIFRPAPAADFDADGIVDGADFLAFQKGEGIATGATRAQGDADANGAVNAADLTIFKSLFGGAPAQAALSAVPEPATLLLAAAGILSLARFRLAGKRGR